ncbi:MAG: hypothetical protein OXI08_10265 [Cyanobacteria bacterium MAG IRC4_bin_6]|nr:hypothetical protein [Cyanobacteria bacterium MAG IRC3_bin_20]MDE0648393.1 hypothetical protein [Cyanobacteria bacterium MAG IRC4_bin_6]
MRVPFPAARTATANICPLSTGAGHDKWNHQPHQGWPVTAARILQRHIQGLTRRRAEPRSLLMVRPRLWRPHPADDLRPRHRHHHPCAVQTIGLGTWALIPP